MQTDHKYQKQRDHFQLGCSENASQLRGISGELLGNGILIEFARKKV